MNVPQLFVGFASGVLFFTGFMGLWQLAEQPNPDGCYMLPLGAEKWMPPYNILSDGGKCLPDYYAADTAGVLLLLAMLMLILGLHYAGDLEA